MLCAEYSSEEVENVKRGPQVQQSTQRKMIVCYNQIPNKLSKKRKTTPSLRPKKIPQLYLVFVPKHKFQFNGFEKLCNWYLFKTKDNAHLDETGARIKVLVGLSI